MKIHFSPSSPPEIRLAGSGRVDTEAHETIYSILCSVTASYEVPFTPLFSDFGIINSWGARGKEEVIVIMVEGSKRFFLCYFESTRQCNLNCRYCMSKAGSEQNGKELSTEEIKHLIIDEVKKYCSHAAIAYSGGESLLRDDIFEILEYTARSGLWSFINTNGTLLTKEKVRQIKKSTKEKIIFVFPLNSLEPQTHNWSRDDDLKTIIRVAKLCEKENVKFFFILTITKNNLGTLKKTIDFLKERRIPVLRAPFVSRGAGKLYPELSFTRQDMEEIIHPALRNYCLSYVSYTPFFASPEFIQNKWRELGINLGQLGCQAAKGFIGISAEGNVAPCVQLLDSEVNCGNVRKKALSEILKTSDILKTLRDRNSLKGKCGRCRYRHTCGGCRALAYYRTGDYLQEDPTCFFEPVDEHIESEYEQIQNKNTAEFIDFISHTQPWSLLFDSL